MKKTLSYLKSYKKECILAPLFKLLEACFELFVPLVIADIIDIGISGGNKGYVWGRVGILALLAVCGLAFALDMPLVLILVGFVYICETLSVILQVTYFKLTHGKRIFKMTPIHHHFELCGWSENKIVVVFASITFVLCIVAFFGVMHRY